jgi:hypothetical protein
MSRRRMSRRSAAAQACRTKTIPTAASVAAVEIV